LDAFLEKCILIKTINNMEKEEKNTAAKLLGSLGGKASANKRLGGKTQSEISEIMKNIRLSKKDKKIISEVTYEEQKTSF